VTTTIAEREPTKVATPGEGGIKAVLLRSLKGAGYGFIPLIGFYLGQKAGGVGWAVAVGAVLSALVIPLELRTTGQMRWCWIGLVGVAFSGTMALLTQDPKLFFLRSVLGDAAFGVAMIGSLVIGKPLIATFASWAVKIPETYKLTPAYKRSFAILTLVWGVVNLARAGGRGYMMLEGSLEQLMIVNLATGWPVFGALVAFSVWYPRRLAHRYVASIGGDAAMVDQILLGAVEETYDLELLAGAEE
jgi:intracellular septation protein A